MFGKRLVELDGGMDEVRLMQLDLAEKSARLQLLIEQMEQELNRIERYKDSDGPTHVNQGELLSTYGIMKAPKQEVRSYEISTTPTP
ncbi:hypothetical protein [Legionella parisiensis]|uniref:Uncharacterized protein n=1 Tax=Legionella parisiensis TaxID=45071 RepID=A0A1E5JSV6_9GAMM|nr:hypothetical protein [Legionella parisiensis]KTD40285.1 hypothetical protein Lpar_1602 [Legionella parisiensis]OEH47619.1 hypothetical protein lpari_01294 [Legionella parisiensis]STX77283.1 Uncharacterised protein [Legionella parisiensis]